MKNMQNHHGADHHESKGCCKGYEKSHGMKRKHGCLSRKFHKLIGLTLFLAVIYIFPWGKINWGTLNLGSQSTISVTGTADGSQKNQIATFRAGATAENTDKETAVQEVNVQMTDLIAKLKEFGIDEADIETQRLNTYETYIGDEIIPLRYPPTPVNRTKGWRASNNVSITLRNVDQASALTDLLNGSGATDVSGPNFRVDDTDELEKELLQEALDNAQEKAESMLAESGQKVGKIVRLSEGSGGGNYRAYDMVTESLPLAGGGAPAPVEVGSQKITKTVTVVFEIK